MFQPLCCGRDQGIRFKFDQICSIYILSADEINVSMMTCRHKHSGPRDCQSERNKPDLGTVEEIPELRVKQSAEIAIWL